MNLRRYIQAGATFAWPLNGGAPLQEARDRHTSVGSPGVVDSPYGRALLLGGAADYVTLGAAWEDQLRFDSGDDDFSVCAWVRRLATGANHAILSKEDGANDGWVLRFNSADAIQMVVNAASAGGPATITDELWHSVIGVVDRSASIYVYVDGVPGSGVAIAGPAMATTAAPRIGADSYAAGAKLAGEVAGAFVIPRILTAAECLGIATGRAF